jgi:sec-independent protein translocase protein TatA
VAVTYILFNGGIVMSMPGMGELVIIFLIVLVLFGAGKIPKIAKDMGSGIREFKKAISGESDDKKEDK